MLKQPSVGANPSPDCGIIARLKALPGQHDSCIHMIVTSGVAIVYNRARSTMQEVVLKRGSWSGHD
jgi:hypothetical protein